MKRRNFLRSVGAAAAGAAVAPRMMSAAESSRRDRPNILVIIGDDATYTDLPLYGGVNARTPHIDQLASEGLTFDRAYLAMSTCQPSRSELFTGLYPMRNGCCWNHSACLPGTESIAHHLGEQGYRVGIAGKIDVFPQRCFPFENVPGYEPSCVARTAEADPSGIRAFMERDSDEPFCLVLGLVTPHVPWTVGNPGRFDPKELELPPYLADTPQTRKDFARYLAELEVLDRQVGDALAVLDESGQADNTVVIFTSEQGGQFPGCKWTAWEPGVHTGFVLRWPGVVAEGERTKAMIQYADVLPTLLEIAGGDPDEKSYDGVNFLSILQRRFEEHRRYAYFMHNNHPGGPSFPIRSVRDREYHYIRNLTPDVTFIQKWIMSVPEHNPYWNTWIFQSPGNKRAARLIERYMRRPAEELYRTSDDPNETHNLADDPMYADVKRRLSAELNRWMRDQNDPGAALDTSEALQARRLQGKLYQEQAEQ